MVKKYADSKIAITGRDLMRRAYGAFRSGNIVEREPLKDAMAWLSFQNSTKSRQIVAEFFHRLDPSALSGLPSRPARPSDNNEYCQGTCSAGKSRLHWVDILSKEAAAALPRYISPRNQVLFRGGLMRWAVERIRQKKGAILWLAELDEKNFQSIRPLDLLGDLGRYGQELKPEDRAVVFTIEVENVYKPTMIDAGFAFFWLAWPDDDSYGMTLGLNDGQPTYREWVVPKDSVKVVDAWPLMPGAGSLADDQLLLAYWDACRQRVLDRRIFSEGMA